MIRFSSSGAAAVTVVQLEANVSVSLLCVLLCLCLSLSCSPQIQTLDIPGEVKAGYSPIGFVRCGRSACKITGINWKVSGWR